MKKLSFLLSVIAIILSGCMGGSNDAQPVNSGKLFENEALQIRYAGSWTKITDLPEGTPTSTIAAFQNPTPANNFYANLNISKESSSDTKNSLDYAKTIIQAHQKNLPFFQKIKEEEITLKINGKDEKTLLYTFDAKADTVKTPILRYQQTYLVKNKDTYIATGTYAKEEPQENVDKITLMLKTFEVK